MNSQSSQVSPHIVKIVSENTQNILSASCEQPHIREQECIVEYTKFLNQISMVDALRHDALDESGSLKKEYIEDARYLMASWKKCIKNISENVDSYVAFNMAYAGFSNTKMNMPFKKDAAVIVFQCADKSIKNKPESMLRVIKALKGVYKANLGEGITKHAGDLALDAAAHHMQCVAAGNLVGVADAGYAECCTFSDKMAKLAKKKMNEINIANKPT